MLYGESTFESYLERCRSALDLVPVRAVARLTQALCDARQTVILCGTGRMPGICRWDMGLGESLHLAILHGILRRFAACMHSRPDQSAARATRFSVAQRSNGRVDCGSSGMATQK
jgi:hypothetical protein